MEQELYRPASPTAARRVFEDVSARWPHRESSSSDRVVWLDTFDWRLFDNRQVLRWVDGTGLGRLVLESVAGEPRRRLELDHRPDFAEELPGSPLRAELERLTYPRRLIPVAEGRRRAQELQLLDRRDKTVASLRFEELQLRQPGERRYREPLGILRLIPVRGFEEPASELRRLLARPGIEHLEQAPFETVLSEVGRRPLDYSSRLRVELEPELRTDASMVRLHRYLLGVIRANEAGAIADLDPEFLHDLRVATRRTRTLLTQVGGVFPSRRVEGFKQGFRWLQGVTGPTRDLHVWLLDLPELEGRADSVDPEALSPLQSHLEARLERELRALRRALQGARYRKLLERWQAFLDRDLPERTSLPNARRPVIEVASTRIWRVYRKMRAEGEAIDRDSPPQALHALRIRGKKLRYLMEGFRTLYPREVEREIRALKRLQDNLGDYNDCAVQRAGLDRFAEEMRAAEGLPCETAKAIEALESAIGARAGRLRSEFDDAFSRFAAKQHRTAFERLFKARRG